MSKQRQAPLADLRTLWRLLSTRVPRLRLRLAAVVVLAIASGLAEAAVFTIVVRVATAVIADVSSVDLPVLPAMPRDAGVVFALALTVLVIVCLLTNGLVQTRLSQLSVRAIRRDLTSAFFASTWTAQTLGTGGHFQQLATGHAARASAAINAAGFVLSGTVMLLTLLVSCVLLAPGAVIGGLAAGAVVVSLLRPIRARVRAAAGVNAARTKELAEQISEDLGLAREVAVHGVGGRVVDELMSVAIEQDTAERRVRVLQRVNGVAYQYVVLALGIAGLAVASRVADAQSLGGLGAVVLLLLRALAYSQQVVGGLQSIAEQAPFLAELEGEINRLRRARRRSGDAPLPEACSVALRRVSFAYPDGPIALKDIDVDIPAGELVGIVGPSGGGKSTLVHLLLRLHDPSEGTISFGGVDIRDVREAAWTAKVALVPQENKLRSTDVIGNVSFYRELSRHDVENALRRAALAAEVAALPAGDATVLGRDGQQLSGGQVQRLGIARALAARPRVLVLDEPTAALDVRSETAVQTALDELRGSSTIFVVAHRPSTIRTADRLLFIEHGRLVDQGPVDELAQRHPFVAEMLSSPDA